MDEPKLIAMLRRHEGERLKPYRDSRGRLTIGVGRNLDDYGITSDESAALLAHDVARTLRGCEARVHGFAALDDVRQRVLADMAFNLGVGGLLTFKQMLAALAQGKYSEAADEMKRSAWHKQVGPRAVELEVMMRTGADPAL